MKETLWPARVDKLMIYQTPNYSLCVSQGFCDGYKYEWYVCGTQRGERLQHDPLLNHEHNSAKHT